MRSLYLHRARVHACDLVCLLFALGHHRIRGKHAEQTGSGVVVSDLLHGRRVRGGAGLHEGQAAQDPAQVRRPGLHR